MKLLEFIFIDFWHWLGAMTLLYVILYYLTNLMNNFMNYRVLMKHRHFPYDEESDSIKEEVNDQNISNR